MPTAAAYDIDLLTRRFKALSDPLRLRVLDRLRGGERCVCELTEALETGQSLLSFHLKTLKDAGLVTDRRDGRWMHYALDAEGLAELDSFLGSLRRRTREENWKPVCCNDR
jgi:ArsR family transcriptional regulator, arsenate/arsenite/antimonite-responsive transcriptional repressor